MEYLRPWEPFEPFGDYRMSPKLLSFPEPFDVSRYLCARRQTMGERGSKFQVLAFRQRVEFAPSIPHRYQATKKLRNPLKQPATITIENVSSFTFAGVLYEGNGIKGNYQFLRE